MIVVWHITREMAQGILPLDKRDVAGEQQKKEAD